MDFLAATHPNFRIAFRAAANGVIICFVLLLASNLASAQDPVACNQTAILKEAARIAISQDDAQDFWRDHLVARIVGLQIRALDLEAALISNRNCGYSYARNAAFIELAEAFARTGKYEKALEVIQELGTDHGWSQDGIDDGVRLQWIDYLIENSDLDRARTELEKTVAPESLPKGLCKLAIELSKSDNQTKAKAYLRLAVEKSLEISEEFDRARSLWEIARTQTTIGDPESATATIGVLVKTSNSFKVPFLQTAALREAAVSAAKNGNRNRAIALFDQAIEARSRVNQLNKMNALNQIAKAQASVNLFDDASKTARMIDRDLSYRSEAISMIAVAHAEANAIDDAVQTALSIVNSSQYQDEALFTTTDHCLETGKTERALKTASQISQPTIRATALLKVATAYATLGDAPTARKIAGGIRLKSPDEAMRALLQDNKPDTFDFENPETWGITYDMSFTMASHYLGQRQSAALAAAAMTLSQKLNEQDSVNYASAFEDVSGEVVGALAKRHAEVGDAKKALAWASRIGSARKIAPNDHKAQWAVERRIYALIGVAEGLLSKRDANPTVNVQ